MLDAGHLLIAALIETAAGVVQGTLGFGINTVAVPLLTFVSVDFVPVPVIVASMLGAAMVMWRERPLRGLGSLRWAVAGRVPGNVIGVAVLRLLSTNVAAVTMASLVLAAVGASGFRTRLPHTPATLFITGVVSGGMGTIAGLGGVPMGLVHQDLCGNRLRALMSSFVVAGGALSLVALGFGGEFGMGELMLTLVLVPGVVLGYLISAKVLPYADARLRQIVLLVASVASLAVIVTRLG